MCKCECKVALCGTCDDVIVNNTCFLIQFYGEQRLGVGTTPPVGSTYTVNVEPSCTQNDKLSPVEMGHCTLLISSFNLRAFTSGTTTTVCTLPTPSSPVDSASLHSGEFAYRQYQQFSIIIYSYPCFNLCRGQTAFIISSQTYPAWNWCTSFQFCTSYNCCCSIVSSQYSVHGGHSVSADVDQVSLPLHGMHN